MKSAPATAPVPPGLSGARVFRLLRPYPGLAVTHAVVIIIGIFASIAFAAVWKTMFDDAIPAGDRALLLRLILIAVALFALTAALLAARAWCVGAQTSLILEQVRGAMKRRLIGQPLSYFSRVSIGDDVARFTSDVNALETLFTIGLPNLVGGAALGAGSLVYMFVLDWRLALLTLGVMPLAAVGPRLLGNAINRSSVARLDQEAAFAAMVKESIATQPVIPLFGLAEHWLAESDQRLDTLRRSTNKMVTLSQLSGFSAIVGVSFGSMAVVCAGAYFAIEGFTTVGSLFGFFTLLLNLSTAATLVAAAIPEIAKAAGGLRRIDELLTHEAPAPLQGTSALPRLSEQITLNGINFTYPGSDRPTINGLDLAIQRGETVAFVGPSGSGKSTVLKVLMRLFDPQVGAIEWDGQDVSEVPKPVFWANLGVVLQETTLFDDSIRQNIRFGRLGASDQEIEAASRAAGLHEVVLSLPEGYDTKVGEGGGRLSGGQRQRVAIARALLRDPDVLVLDEITASLDPATEAEVNETIERLRGERVIVSVTHRLAAITGYDRIFVLDQGCLVESGDHGSLLTAGGIYANLFGRQEGLTVSSDGRRAEVDTRALSRIPLLAEIDADDLQLLTRRFVSERYSDGATLFVQGDPGDCFYLIARGAVDLFTETRTGGEKRVVTLHEGDYLGEIALLRDVPRTATARVRGQCVLLSLSREDFSGLLGDSPQIAAVLQAAAERRMESPWEQ